MSFKKYVLFFFISFSFFGFSQNVEFTKKNFDDKKGLRAARKNIVNGDAWFDQGYVYYRDALPFYLKAQEFNANNAKLNYKIGMCFLESASKQKASKYLQRAIELNPTVDKYISYYLGYSYHLNMDWDKATYFYNEFLKQRSGQLSPNGVSHVQNRINQCNNGREIVTTPIKVKVENVSSNINTEWNEYGAVISADESMMLFTARQPSSSGGRLDPLLNETYEDIYMSTKQADGQWGKPVCLPKPVNGPDHDAVCAVSPDGQKFIMYGKKNGGDLFESTLSGTVWSEPVSLGNNINTSSQETSACYSPDGNTLYIVSDMPGGSGKRDIYMSKRDASGVWGVPVNLGKTINTPFNEEGIYMHPDGKTLYFSSEGHTSIGGYDIFKSVFDQQTGTWSTPENMGYPVNTVDDDVFFVMNASGERAYYMSINPDGKGGKDLYQATFQDKSKEEPQLTLVKGIIIDSVSRKPLEAKIEIVDNETGKVFSTLTSNSETGKYLVSLPSGKNYGISVSKEGYLFHSENFDLPEATDYQEFTKDIELKRVLIGSKVTLNNIFFDFDKSTLRPESTTELNRLSKLLKDNPYLKIEISGHTDNVGSVTYNQKLSEARAKAVVDFLIGDGVSQDRVSFKGYGESQPVSTNQTAKGRQLNRRTEFKVLDN
jgi:outer membrane protein OmpA-like peptidoglycan-associated protein